MEIEKAILIADQEEAEASIELAKLLMKEQEEEKQEEEERRRRRLHNNNCGNNSGNVRTVTHSEFESYRMQRDNHNHNNNHHPDTNLDEEDESHESHTHETCTHESNPSSSSPNSQKQQQQQQSQQERILFGKDDYEEHQSQYIHDIYHQNYEDARDLDDLQHASSEGYRINASNPSRSGWARIDKHTVMGPKGEVRTKHDIELKNRSNAERLLLLQGETSATSSSSYSSGAGVGDKAYNAFHQSLKQVNKRSVVKGVAAHGTGRAENRDAEKTRGGGAMDSNVRLIIMKAINAGIIQTCNGVVKEGKEAMVYHAVGGKDVDDFLEDMSEDDDEDDCKEGKKGHHHRLTHILFRHHHKDESSTSSSSNNNNNNNSTNYDDNHDHDLIHGFDVAVKVFKRNPEFKTRCSYVDGDPRYHGRKFRSMDRREQVEVWAEKEYRNLIRAFRAGVPVPLPILQKNNVLFMRFLGEDCWPAPQLREIELKRRSKKWRTLYCQTMLAIKRLYQCAKLVHGDLSEYNILVCPTSQVVQMEDNGKIRRDGETMSDEDTTSSLQIVLIDFGQAVEYNHPSSSMLLKRDLLLVQSFFSKRGTETLNVEESIAFVLHDYDLDESDAIKDNDEDDEGEHTSQCDDVASKENQNESLDMKENCSLDDESCEAEIIDRNLNLSAVNDKKYMWNSAKELEWLEEKLNDLMTK